MRSGLHVLKTSTFRLVIIYLAVFAMSVGAVLAYVYWNTALLIERQLEETVRAEFQSFRSGVPLRRHGGPGRGYSRPQPTGRTTRSISLPTSWAAGSPAISMAFPNGR